MILVSYFEKPKPKIPKIEITKHHGFSLGICQLPNQTDQFSLLVRPIKNKIMEIDIS